MKIEYRIKPVTRYIVTRFEGTEGDGGARQIGNEYDSSAIAFEVGYAVCKVEHDRLGWPADDERIQYPRPVELASAAA